MAKRLITAKTLEAGPRNDVDKELWDVSLKGFGLRRTQAGRGGFFIRYNDTVTSISRRMSTGKYHVANAEHADGVLKEARILAKELMAMAASGTDPKVYLAEKLNPAARADMSVAGLFQRYYTHRVLTECRESTGKEIKRCFEADILPKFGEDQLATLSGLSVREHFEKKALTAPIAANRLHAHMSAFWTWAASIAELERAGITHNPLIGKKKPFRNEQARDRVLSSQELHRLMNILPDVRPQGFASLVEFLLRTGCRKSEGTMLTWDRIDLEVGTIRFDASHTKNKEAMVIPITPALKALLEAQEGRTGAVFVNSLKQPLRNNFHRMTIALWAAMSPDNDEAGIPKRTTLHDLRRTMRTALTDQLGVDNYTAERTLGHKLGGVEGIYARGDYMKAKLDALQRWENHLATIASDGKVVPLNVRSDTT
jgi:integrase